MKVDRREFLGVSGGCLVAKGVPASLGSLGVSVEDEMRCGYLSDSLAERLGSDFVSIENVGELFSVPVEGVSHHVWAGNAASVRAGEVAQKLVSQLLNVLQSSTLKGMLTKTIREFLGSHLLAAESFVSVLCVAGHVTCSRSFKDMGVTVESSVNECGSIARCSRNARKFLCHFPGTSPEFNITLDLPEKLYAVDDVDDIVTWSRPVKRRFSTPQGLLAGEDHIVQFATASGSFEDSEFQAVLSGGGFPANALLREPLGIAGYADTTTITLARTVFDVFGSPYVDELVISLNAGHLRSGLLKSKPNNPDEILDLNLVHRPLERYYEQRAFCFSQIALALQNKA